MSDSVAHKWIRTCQECGNKQEVKDSIGVNGNLWKKRNKNEHN